MRNDLVVVVIGSCWCFFTLTEVVIVSNAATERERNEQREQRHRG